MDDQTITSRRTQRSRYITALCIFLWIGALAFIGLGVWAAIHGAGLYAGFSFAGAILMLAAGLGLFHMRRWGVAAFALFVVLGGANQFSRALMDLSAGGGLLAALNLVIALAITIFMIYLVLLLWRNTK